MCFYMKCRAEGGYGGVEPYNHDIPLTPTLI